MTNTVLSKTRLSGRPATKSKFRGDVQGLRALAVVLVVLNHANVPGLPGGYVGVDVFFVISGFVITQSMLGADNSRGISIAKFYAARARRILPMSTLVIVSTCVASFLLLNFVRAEQVAADALAATFFGANFHFAAQGTDYFAADTPPSPLQHFWSLAVEEQFYLVWPLLLGFLIFGVTLKTRRSGHRVPTNRILLVLGFIMLASFVWSVAQTQNAQTLAYFSPLTRTWELAAGAVLAVGAVYVERQPERIRAIMSWVGLGGIVVSATTFTDTTSFPGYHVALPVLSTVLVIAGGSAVRGGAATVLAIRPLRMIGNWSFSIYLWHWPALVILAGYLGRELSLTESVTVVLMSVALSYVTWRWVEEPFRKSEWLKTGLSHSLVLWPASIAVSLCALLIINSSLLGDELNRVGLAAAAAPASSPNSAPAVNSSEAPVDTVIDAVRASVRAARSGEEIPLALSPSVDQVDADIFEMPGCTAGTGDTSSSICEHGSIGATNTIVIIGDSHAEHWVPALDQIGLDLDKRIIPLVKHGCSGVDVTAMLSNGQPFSECNEWREWAINKALEYSPEAIIMSSTIAGSVQNAAGEALTDSRIQEISTLWSTGVESSARQLASGGARVVVLSDAPGVGEAPTECLLRRDVTMASCTWPQVQRTTILNEATGLGATAANVLFVDLTEWFCYDGECPLVVGSTVAYRDTGHLTITYARQVATQLASKLELTL